MPWETTTSSVPSDIVLFYTNGGSDTYLPQQNTALVTSVFKPTASRRVKPSDLFASATPWQVISKITKYGRHEQWESLSSTTTRRTRAQASYWYGLGADDFQPDFGQADLRMRLRIKDEQVNLPLMISEVGQTTEMLFGFARDLNAAFDKLRRGQPIAAVRRILGDPRTRGDRALANRWLEYSFGLAPTMSDIYGLAEAVVTRLNEGMYHYTGTRLHQKSSSRFSEGLFDCAESTDTLYRVRCRYKVQNSVLTDMKRLGITNPASFIWDKVPWSFAVDWGTGIGDFLGGLDALVGISDLTVLRSYGRDRLVQAKLPANIRPLEGYGALAIGKERTRLAPTSDLSFGTPRIKSIFETGALGTRLANASALLRQITGRTR